MQLCDKDIHKAIHAGELLFTGTNPRYPFRIQQVQPASIDLRLDNKIFKFSSVESLDIKDLNVEMRTITEYVEDGSPIIIKPGEILFGQIYELMDIGNMLSARVEGRSRAARLGISVHCTGSYINPGFCGAVPLQIINHNSFKVVLYPYISICQLTLFRISDEPLIKYSDKAQLPFNPYFNEVEAGPSVLNADTLEGISGQTMLEQRMHRLIESYYDSLKAQIPSTQTDKIKQISTVEKINVIVENNISQGGYANIMSDTYNVKQGGNVGRGAGKNSQITQVFTDSATIDYYKLGEELERIKNYLKSLNQDDDNDILIGDITRATKALQGSDRNRTLEIIRSCGSKLYDIAKSIGCTIIAKVITNAMGL